MHFPVESLSGKCDPEFTLEVGCAFPTGPQAETASHSEGRFRDTLSEYKEGHLMWPSTYICCGYPHDKPRSNNKASVRAEAYKVHREFRTQRRPLNVASVLRRTVRAGDVAPYARPGPPGSRQLDDRCKTFHQLFGLAGFFELDLDHVSGDRDHGTGAKGLVAHGIARGKVL